MRDLKFRAWHIQAQEMLYDKANYVFAWKYEGQPVKIMQYTGLKDRNRVEIYEGDILYSYTKMINLASGNPTGKMKKTISAVKWIDKKCCFSIDSLFSMNSDIISKYQTIIGNIYKNPELLIETS